MAGDAVAAEACAAPAASRRAREQGSATLELRIATDLARLLPDPAGAAEARAAVAAVHARFTEGFGTRDLREAAALLEADQLTTPAPAGTSTGAPSTTG